MTPDDEPAGRAWYRVSLRIMGDGVPVDDLAAALGVEPTHVGRKGEHIGGDTRRATYGTNVWVLASTSSSRTPFEEQVPALLDTLEPHRATLRELFSMPGIEGELFLGYGSESGQGGGYFPAELLERIVAFGLALSLDLYPPGDADE